MTAKIYTWTITKAYRMDEIGDKFVMYPWHGGNDDYGGEDDGGIDYVLPDGFEVAQGADDHPHIYDAGGEYCELISVGDSPAIAISGRDYPLKLKKA